MKICKKLSPCQLEVNKKNSAAKGLIMQLHENIWNAIIKEYEIRFCNISHYERNYTLHKQSKKNFKNKVCAIYSHKKH